MVCAFLLCGLVAVTFACEAGERLTLAKRDEQAQYSIVIPDKAMPSVVYAAQELRDYTAKMTGVGLSIVTNEMPQKGVFIRIERGKDEYDWFRIKVDGDSLTISGNERGVLYGVYEILETYGGCGWFSSTTEVVPKVDTFGIPGDLDRFEKAAFICRDVSWFDVVSHPEFAARMRFSGPHLNRRDVDLKFGEPSVVYDPELFSSHSFCKLMPADKYFQKHPEFFCERNGFRERHQPCLSNREARRVMKEALLAHIEKRYPKYKYYSVSQNDNNFYCTCSSCKVLDEREGSPAASIIDFVNEMADAVKEKYPDVVLHTLAYMYSVKAPKSLKVRDNVMVVLCTDQCDHGRKMEESRNGNNKHFIHEFSNWSRIAKRIKIWDYTADFTCYMLAHPNLKSLRPNFSFFKKGGASHVFAQGASQGPYFDLAELRAWLIGKLLWNPEQPVAPLIDRFCTGYYGSAAPFAKQYIARMQSFDVDERVRPLHMWGNPKSEFVPAAFYDEAAIIWAEAAKLVSNDPIRARNVRLASIPIDWCRVFYSNYGALAEVTRCPEYVNSSRFRELQDAARNVARLFREEPKSATIGEVKQLVRQMRRRIDYFASLDPTTVKAADKICVEEGFAVVEEQKGVVERVEDLLSGDGKAYKLSPVPNAQVVIEMNDVHTDPDGLYKIRAKVRIERTEKHEGEAFYGAVSDSSGTLRPKSIIRKGYFIKDVVSNGYAWYDITDPWIPNPTHTVKFSIGEWNRKTFNRNLAIKAVYLDAFEIVRVK